MRTKMCCITVIIAGITVCACPAESVTRQTPGLTVHEGRLIWKGRSYRGIGANYFSLFSRTLKDPNDRSFQTGLHRLSQAQIPFVRFMACGFWPVDWDLYLHDKDEWFQCLDGVVKCAEKHEIGLIPSLFWYMPTVSDIVGESMDQLGNPGSQTSAFIRQYTKEVVLRYRHSPAIWGWEFGNEYNLHVDLPNASEHRPPVWPQLKTALTRTTQDELSAQAMLTAFAEFAGTVRKYDKHRILITGNSLPRPSAYHNSREKSWKRDSAEQFAEILLRDNPDPFDTLCVHVYPQSDYPAQAKDPTDLIKTFSHLSVRAGKPLFIGEFGTPLTLGEKEERERFLELVHAIEAHAVPLSAFWVFDYAGQDKDWNVTFSNRRNYMLQLVAEANQRMTKELQNEGTIAK
jgi:hypothetical protein